MRQLPLFYRNEHEWHAIANRLKLTPCPHCKRVGTLNRHGHLYGYHQSQPSQKTHRAHRVFCSNRNRRPGCGHTFSVWQADTIRRRSLSADALWQFLLRVLTGTIAAAIRASLDYGRSDRTWQRFWQRFKLAQSNIRTALSTRCPEPALPTSHRPADQAVAHLQAAFPNDPCPITAFQHTLQTFLV